MTLSAEHLAEIIGTLSEKLECPPLGHRRSPRIGIQAEVQIACCTGALANIGNRSASDLSRLLAEGEIWKSVRIKNISTRGVCLAQTQPLAVGQQFILRLPHDGDAPALLLCTVLHCRGGPPYVMGAEFTCPVLAANDSDSAEVDRIRNSVLG